MPPPEARNSVVLGTKEINLAKPQDRDFRIVIMNMLKDLKEDMNNCLNEDHENTNS